MSVYTLVCSLLNAWFPSTAINMTPFAHLIFLLAFSPLVTANLLSVAMSLILFYCVCPLVSFFGLCSPHDWHHTVLVFFCLISRSTHVVSNSSISFFYRLTHVRMSIIEKTRNDKSWRGDRKKETLVDCWWERTLVQPLWKMVRRLLKKLRIEQPYDPAVPLLGIYPENMKTLTQKDA